MQDIGKWAKQRGRFWKKHIKRKEDKRLVKIVNTNNPLEKISHDQNDSENVETHLPGRRADGEQL